MATSCEPQATRYQLPSISRTLLSMHRSLGHHPRVQLDFAKGILVSGHVLLQNPEQCFGLLRAQINSLEVLDFYLRFRLLQQGSENQEEIPDVDADLHAVGVVFSVCGSIRKLHVRLSRIRHKAASVAVWHAGRKRRLHWSDGFPPVEAPESCDYFGLRVRIWTR